MEIKVGNTVRVLNRNMGGKVILEGLAVVKHLYGTGGAYASGMKYIHAAVQFPGLGEPVVKRTIQPDAQRGTLEEMKERYGIED